MTSIGDLYWNNWNFFKFFVDINGKCNSGSSLCQIVELVWYWAHGMHVIQTMKWTGRSQHTVSDWYNLCHDICVDQFEKRTKMGCRIRSANRRIFISRQAEI